MDLERSQGRSASTAVGLERAALLWGLLGASLLGCTPAVHPGDEVRPPRAVTASAVAPAPSTPLEPEPADGPSVAAVASASPAAGSPPPAPPLPSPPPPPARAVYVAAGQKIACAALDDGRVLCWGAAGFVGSLFPKGHRGETPLEMPGLHGAMTIAIGIYDDLVCGLSATGEVRCLHDEETFANPVLEGARSLAVGLDHACAITDDRGVACWGNGDHGVLGVASEFEREPRRIVGLTGIAGITAGAGRSCAWNDAGDVRCWGRFQAANDRDALTPVAAPQLGPATVVVSAKHKDCALHHDGTVQCGVGRRPILRRTAQGGFVDGRGVRDAMQLAVGNQMACAITQAAEVWCWGNAKWGRLGHGKTFLHIRDKHLRWRTPSRMRGLPKAIDIATSGLHTCVRDENKAVWCWGSNVDGEVGRGAPPGGGLPPGRVETIDDAEQLALGSDFTCALRGDGSIWCWGENAWGQCGTGSGDEQELVPARVALP
ncbi:MAG: hypothetical protein AAF715_15525 [Myxococcota bacterium]